METLRRRANCDALTGLSNRAHFLGQLDAMLHREDGSAESGLVLLRILDLAELNRSIGHASTDRLIETVAQALQAYTTRVAGCFVGRLNGADFAMCLPAGGVAEETARAVASALQAVLPAFGRQGGGGRGCGGGRARHDAGRLDVPGRPRAGAGRGARPVPGRHRGRTGPVLARMGEGGWRRRLHEALGAGRVTLVEYPVLGKSDQLMHLECPLRVQLEPEGEPEPAARWLPLAVRARLTAALDERALSLALGAIALDGQARAVNLAAASLFDSGFAARLRAQLMQAPRAARRCGWRCPRPRPPITSIWFASSAGNFGRPGLGSAWSTPASASVASSGCSSSASIT
ncbi:diguanylate cyclase [Piscinibacter aquaticus]|uniref:Diguanylate cyclase n=1 Tax=Piscinibacter aquaticus TaxID=392597 RepID=A0A5C6U1N3_9BURK|nr:diguanylate cyclase [Piscinibacter aquaticus]